METKQAEREVTERPALGAVSGSAAGERRYRVKEIDALRRACEMRWLYGTTHIVNGGWSRQWRGAEKDMGVEELVRTHVIAGHTAEDIYKEDEPPNH